MLEGSLADHLAAITAGDKSMPVSKARRHHFVPQFLLANFATPSEHGAPKLRVLDKTTGCITEVTTRGAAWERNLYAVYTDRHREAELEGFLSLVEDHAASSLVRLISDPMGLEEGDRCNLSVFLELQESRTPAALAESREVLRHMGTMFANLALGNATGRRHRVQQAREALLAGRIAVEPSDGLTLALMIKPILEVSQHIQAMPWVVLRAADGEFVLSDRPLTRHDPTPPHAFSAAAWKSSRMVYTTLPLGPMHCLRISPTGSSRLAVRATTRQVDSTNLRTYGWATRYVFGRYAETLVALHARALANPEAVPTSRPKRIVLLEDPETADPEDADHNRSRGWAPYVNKETGAGHRPLSYRVIDTVDDVGAAMAPKPRAAKSRSKPESPW